MLTEVLIKVALLGAEWVLYLLLVPSVISLGVIAARALVYRRSAGVLAGLEEEMLKLPGRSRKARGPASGRETALLGDLAKAVSEGNGDDSLVQSQVQGVVATYRRYLDRSNAVLGTLGNNAPFIGLLGTVIGVIVAFNELKTEMEGGAGSVMGGISEALVATAAGLAVAIPAVVAFNYFAKLSGAYVERFELLAWMKARGGRVK